MDQPNLTGWELLARLARRRRLIGAMAVIGVATGFLIAWLPGERYTVQVAFLPESAESGRAPLTSLAAEFGISVGSDVGSESPDFYLALLQSRSLLERVAGQSFAVVGMNDHGLADLLGFSGKPGDERRDQVMRWLRQEAVSLAKHREAGLVQIRVQTRWPELSQQLAGALLGEVAHFNTVKRRTRAGEERRFLHDQILEMNHELESREEELKAFLQSNRLFQESPELQFEHDRLQRDVAQRRTMLASLQQALQQARLTEVRDTPLISILQDTYRPLRPDRRFFTFKIALGFVTGLLVGGIIAILLPQWSPRTDDDRRAYRDIVAIWRGKRALERGNHDASAT